MDTSLPLDLAAEFSSDALANLPSAAQKLLGSALIMGGVSALVLTVIVPGGGVGAGETDFSDRRAPDLQPDVTDATSTKDR